MLLLLHKFSKLNSHSLFCTDQVGEKEGKKKKIHHKVNSVKQCYKTKTVKVKAIKQCCKQQHNMTD